MREQPEGVLQEWSENLASLSSVILRIGDRDDAFSWHGQARGYTFAVEILLEALDLVMDCGQ